MRKTIGILMVLSSISIICYNLWAIEYNKNQLDNHLLYTVVNLGENLKSAYTFTPPYTNFELTVIGVGIVGLILCVIKVKSQ